MKTIIKAGQIASPNGILCKQNIFIEDGIISEIIPDAETHSTEQQIDAQAYLVAPGFIDIHTHGAVGHNFINSNHEQVDKIGIFFAKHGVTRYLATLMENEHHKYTDALSIFQTYEPAINAAIPLGIHLEGPYLSPTYPGDMGTDNVRLPDPDEYLPWFESGIVRMITIAPELPGSLELIQAAREHNIVISIGHGAPNETQTRAAIEAGASQISHMFNQMAGLNHHRPGLADAALLDETIALQLIADDDHLHPVVIQFLAKLKKPENLILITDSTEENGADQPTVSDNKAMPGNLTLDQAVRNMQKNTHLSPLDIFKMASLSPAKSFGIENQFGTIKPGASADFVVLDQQMQVVMTIINGQVAYDTQIKGA